MPYGNLEDPQSLDLYTCVENNPVSDTDPDGHYRQSPDGASVIFKVSVWGNSPSDVLPGDLLELRSWAWNLYSSGHEALLNYWHSLGCQPGQVCQAGMPDGEILEEFLDGLDGSASGTDAQLEPSRGSTGRAEPENLNEQIAMKAAKSDPAGGRVLERVTMTDSRWPASEGWVKMTQNINGVEVH